jgi:Transposase IS66 family
LQGHTVSQADRMRSEIPASPHARREVFEAKDIEPAHAGTALDYIGALYQVEAQIREHGISGAAKRACNRSRSGVIVSTDGMV